MIHDPFPIHYSPFSISHFLTFLFWANTHRYQVTEFGLPGMRILQFGFSSPSDPFLPHNYIQHCVAYTGTHDNDTALGWLATASQKERDLALRYLHSDGHDFAWDLIRAIWSSVAMFAVAPMQDVLSLGGEARMNYPSRLGGNWEWRMGADDMSDALAEKLADLNFIYLRGAESR